MSGQGGDGTDQRVPDGGAQCHRHDPVDLDPVGGQPKQILQRRPARAEIVQQHPETALLQLMHEYPIELSDRQVLCFGELKIHRLRPHPAEVTTPVTVVIQSGWSK